MKPEEELKKRLARLEGRAQKIERLIHREENRVEELYRLALAEAETEKKEKLEAFSAEETTIRGQADQAGKEFAQEKYKLERDTAANREDFKRAEERLRDIQKKTEQDLTRLNEERLNVQISHDRQISALKDLYEEKRRHVSVSRGALAQSWQASQQKLAQWKEKSARDFDALETEWHQKITNLKNQSDAKKEGWQGAIEAMRRELDASRREREHIEKRLVEIRDEKEKEMEAAKMAIALAREQLEMDKATLIEKAEEDQRRCESEIEELKKNIEASEHELQELVSRHENSKKDAEEAFIKEESMLKEAVRTESERRDYEQRLFEQEKSHKEKELARLREEYEKKKWHWDNQIRTLTLQKSVQDSEHEAERLRVDREARTLLRSLEAKRDELRQRLADVKNRTSGTMANAKKEEELINQRWHWRRDRLWSLWQNRLEVLKKERVVLHEQIKALEKKFSKEQAEMADTEAKDLKRTENLESFLMLADEQKRGLRKQKEIQFELEKTRIYAQIKETETLVEEWMERLKATRENVAKNNIGIISQMDYLEKWYRDEEKETQLFIETLEQTLQSLEGFFAKMGLPRAA